MAQETMCAKLKANSVQSKTTVLVTDDSAHMATATATALATALASATATATATATAKSDDDGINDAMFTTVFEESVQETKTMDTPSSQSNATSTPSVATKRGDSTKFFSFFVDWDDTLFPTTWAPYVYDQLQARAKPDHKPTITAPCQNEVAILERQVCFFLNTLKAIGRICIVTNASYGWVESCVQYVYPLLVGYIGSVQMPVVSAAALYAKQSNDMTQWKFLTFSALTTTTSCHGTLVSIGDSLHERHALQRLLLECHPVTCTAVTWTLLENPTPELLRRQLPLVLQRIVDQSTQPQMDGDYRMFLTTVNTLQLVPTSTLSLVKRFQNLQAAKRLQTRQHKRERGDLANLFGDTQDKS